MAKDLQRSQGTVQVVTVPEQIINHLNEVLGTNYQHTTVVTKKLIAVLLKRGCALQDFQYVHLIKADEWLGTDMEKYLRPKTLYAEANFESYRNQRPRNQRQGKNVAALLDWMKKQHGSR